MTMIKKVFLCALMFVCGLTSASAQKFALVDMD